MTFTETDTFVFGGTDDDTQNGHAHDDTQDAKDGENDSTSWKDNDSATYKQCAAPDCTSAARSRTGKGPPPKYCQEHSNATARRKSSSGSSASGEDDPFAAPFTATEKRLVKQLELPIRLLGAGVYRANVIDGLIIGDNATQVAQAWVLEGRVSKSIRQMSEAVAKFAGAGPLAMVGIDIGLQIANNHHIPVIGDLKAVPVETQTKAARIMQAREARQTNTARTVATETGARISTLIVCSSCGRNNLRQPGLSTMCMCGLAIAN